MTSSPPIIMAIPWIQPCIAGMTDALKNSIYGGGSTMSRGIFLWTISELPAVRHLYKACGFTPIETKSHFIRGRDIVEELREIDLSARPVAAG
jgi:hypothetical protein